MNTIVIYKSKYGATETYAKWIAEDLGCEAVKADDIKKKDLLKYDLIVYGGGIHAGGIIGFDLIKKAYRKLADKKIIVFAVGMNPMSEDIIKELKDINLNKKTKDLRIFYLVGAFDPSILKGFDAWLINRIKGMIKRIPVVNRTDSENENLNRLNYGGNWIDRDSILPIVEEAKIYINDNK
ncbi:MAG: flavodoxin [Clostridia bacterium]|nr:flavodoxin [Clostridia bacterium]